MHGDAPEVIVAKVADLKSRRAVAGRPPLMFGVSVNGFVAIPRPRPRPSWTTSSTCARRPRRSASYQDFVEGSQLRVAGLGWRSIAASNRRGLRSGLFGTQEQIIERLRAYEDAGVGLMLLQFSPQREEMARFGKSVISRYAG